ncbi:MAG: insulinase family protein, partial [Bacteroidales bacterium]|nr:insulinase family protein [Bacteroidales bacterium]
KVKDIFTYGQEITYYGPMSVADFTDAFKAAYNVNTPCPKLPEKHNISTPVTKNEVFLVQYDAKQLYYNQYSCRDEKFNPETETVTRLYNNYFGGGMNGIVFQEMREARGLAYSANARFYTPSYLDDNAYFMAFIATQNDKMKIAIEAFDDIINNMPQSEAAFSIAKENLITNLRTARTTRQNVLNAYKNCRRLGLEAPMTEQVFTEAQDMTLADIVAYQQQNIKGRCYKYGILGDIKDLDVKYLRTLGPVTIVPLNDIFGF